MKTKIASLITMICLMSFAGQSQDNWNERQHTRNQCERIREGWESGELTPGEYRYLSREQRRLRHAERRMYRDGYFSPGERHRLREMKRECSRDIWRKKHNHCRRYR